MMAGNSIFAYLARQLLELRPMQGQWHWEAVELLLSARKLFFPSRPLRTGVGTDLPCSLNTAVIITLHYPPLPPPPPLTCTGYF